MISLSEYVGHWKDSPDWDTERQTAAIFLLDKVADLQTEMIADGVVFQINTKTGSEVSGEVYGGFRPQSCPIGAPHSNHKEGRAVDVYDPYKHLTQWCFGHQAVLKRIGLYMEHPDSTPGWLHVQSVAPSSGKTVFLP